MQIAVAGGTGCVGKLVVEAIHARGDVPVILARSAGVDLTTGAGLEKALRDVSAVIDVCNITTIRKNKAIAFFEATTSHLLAAGKRAGITHHIALSIVGCDRVDLGYYRGKRRQEELVLAGGVPASVLRATQFHEFTAQMLARSGPLAIVPKMLSQPIAAGEVADALVTLAVDAPIGLAPDLAGPEQRSMPDMVRQLLRARGWHRPVVQVPLPGAVGRALASGGLLPAADGPRGIQTFDEWLVADSAANARKINPDRP
jgi:uncharacterized protein YbjT (DUF2867 family)